MHVDAILRERLISSADKIEEPCETALAEVMDRVTSQRKKHLATSTALIASALLLAWLAVSVDTDRIVESPAPPASTPVTRDHQQQRVPPAPEEIRAQTSRQPALDGSVKVAHSSEGPRRDADDVRRKNEAAEASGGSPPAPTDPPRRFGGMTRTFGANYDRSPVGTEIDRRSGCSVTYWDCVHVQVKPTEAAFSVSVLDSQHRVVLVRVAQWGPGNNTVVPTRWLCSDSGEQVRIHPDTRSLELSLESGSCPDGREAQASSGRITVTLFEGDRAS